jgi:precorrin-2/cobalt-factor-2 C20-methyltransferase
MGQAMRPFYGVGLGPGDPELLTRKAERILREVDWIFLPGESARQTSFAGSILAALDLPARKFRTVALCMTHEPKVNEDNYHRAAEQIVGELRQGKSVAWATEGDPLFYSTFLHLRQRIVTQAPEVRIEIVPGVTSIQAASARAGVAMALRDEQVAVLPATYGIEQLPELLAQFATIFLLKVHLALDRLLDLLDNLEVPVKAWYLEHVGTPRERVVVDLKSLRGQALPYFSLVILKRGERT